MTESESLNFILAMAVPAGFIVKGLTQVAQTRSIPPGAESKFKRKRLVQYVAACVLLPLAVVSLFKGRDDLEVFLSAIAALPVVGLAFFTANRITKLLSAT